MDWARRVLTDTDDDGRYRSGLAAILGASIAILTLLFGLVDARTFLIAALVGFVVIAPLWRYFGEDLAGPLPVIAFAAFLIASVIVVKQLPDKMNGPRVVARARHGSKPDLPIEPRLMTLFEGLAKRGKGVALSMVTRDGLCSVCNVRMRPPVLTGQRPPTFTQIRRMTLRDRP